jgi:hypothetical protein
MTESIPRRLVDAFDAAAAVAVFVLAADHFRAADDLAAQLDTEPDVDASRWELSTVAACAWTQAAAETVREAVHPQAFKLDADVATLAGREAV